MVADWFKVYDGYSGAEMIEIGKEYRLEQLHQIIVADHYDSCAFKGGTEYAVFDSENDQKKELAIRLNCVGIDGGEENTGTTTLIFKEIDGKLFLCDSIDTWSRGEHTQYYYGFRNGGGSGGASNYI